MSERKTVLLTIPREQMAQALGLPASARLSSFGGYNYNSDSYQFRVSHRILPGGGELEHVPSMSLSEVLACFDLPNRIPAEEGKLPDARPMLGSIVEVIFENSGDKFRGLVLRVTSEYMDVQVFPLAGMTIHSAVSRILLKDFGKKWRFPKD